MIDIEDLLDLAEANSRIASTIRDPWPEAVVDTFAKRHVRLSPRSDTLARFQLNLAAFGSAEFDSRWLEPSTVESAPDLPIWRRNDPGLSE